MNQGQPSLAAYPTPLIELEDYSPSRTIVLHIGFAKAFKRIEKIKLPVVKGRKEVK